jgi:hypothetical protein
MNPAQPTISPAAVNALGRFVTHRNALETSRKMAEKQLAHFVSERLLGALRGVDSSRSIAEAVGS